MPLACAPMLLMLLPALLQAIPPDSGEVHLRNIRQLTFGGQNAEAYFSRSGRQIIFQRQEADSGCDQEFVMNVDGTGLDRKSTRLNSSHVEISYAVFCLKKKKKTK